MENYIILIYKIFIWKRVREMEVNNIPIPSVATIKVSKEGKAAVFDTTVIHTTDNKYIYVMPVKEKDKFVNFSGDGMFREIKIQFAPYELYVWKNISITKFVEDGKLFLRIRTTTPGARSNSWKDRAAKREGEKEAQKQTAVEG